MISNLFRKISKFLNPIGSNLSPSNELHKLVNGRGHKDFFCLDSKYSPGSRVPAIDFSPWIKAKIEAHDISALKTLMWEIVRGNPGLSIGTDNSGAFKEEWFSVIDEIINLDLLQYVSSNSPVAILDLKTLMFFTSIQDGLSGFFLSSQLPISIAKIMLPWNVNLLNAEPLILRANKFIRKLRKDTPYWKDVPLFKSSDFVSNTVSSESANVAFLNALGLLPISSRLHFFDICSWTDFGSKPATRPIEEMTTYETRLLGIDSKESSQLLLDANLVKRYKDPRLFLKKMNKEDLFAILNKAGIEFKKNFKKEELIDFTLNNCGTIIEELSSTTIFANISPDISAIAQTEWKRIYETVEIYKLIMGFSIPSIMND
jgi:hypothetical protein